VNVSTPPLRTGRFDPPAPPPVPALPALPTARPITRGDVMTSTDVAELLRTSKSTIEDWARRGVIPSRKRGRRRFFLRWEVEAWLIADD
jgi:excisionase family DNA binding protein